MFKYIGMIFVLIITITGCNRSVTNEQKNNVDIETTKKNEIEREKEFIRKMLEEDSLTINKDKIKITNLLSNEFKQKFVEMKEQTKRITFNLNNVSFYKESKEGNVKVTFTSICQIGLVIPERIKTYMIVTVDNKTNLISLYEHRNEFYLDGLGLSFINDRDFDAKEEFLINEKNLNQYQDSLTNLIKLYLDDILTKEKNRNDKEIKRKNDALKAL